MIKQTQNYTYQTISAILFIVLIIFAGLYFTKKTTSEVEEQECPEPKALVFGILHSWGENFYDSSEYLLGVNVYNFGEIEAKNVELKCDIYVGNEEGYTISETPVTTVTKRIGNIASTSFKYSELEAEKNIQKEGSYPLAVCSVSCCDDCKILNDIIEE